MTKGKLNSTLLPLLTVSLLLLAAAVLLPVGNRAVADDLPDGWTSYITPEQYGAKGDGVTDDTEAFHRCMTSSQKNILLSGTYLVRRYLTAGRAKYFYAVPRNGGPGATIICEPVASTKSLSFSLGVVFENVAFSSSFSRTGISPHGEIYQSTSNIMFVEVWNTYGTFTNCSFNNALIAIRGRKSSGSTVVPSTISIRNCSFTECKIPVQGYSRETTIQNCRFVNNGDVYSGDHCVYMERYGCTSVRIQGCTVETLNSDSGAAFQIYGSAGYGSNGIPELTVSDCTIDANGIVSTSEADVTIRNCVFTEQQPDEFIAWVEVGSLTLIDSTLNHSYAFSYASTNVGPVARNCVFKLMKDLNDTRCNFPLVSESCIYVNWGGNVRRNGTVFEDCTFTNTCAGADGSLFISNKTGYSISLRKCRFHEGNRITDNENAILEYTDCSTF